MPEFKTNDNKPKFSIILPLSGDERLVSLTLAKYANALRMLEHSFELIAVTDSNPSLEQLPKNTTVVHTASSNSEWGKAVRLGIAASAGETIAYCCAERSSTNSLIEVLKCAIALPDAVVTVHRRSRDGWLAKLGSFLFNLECRTLHGILLWDINATPKAFPRRYADLMRLTRDDELLDLEFCIKCREAAYPVVTIPVSPAHETASASVGIVKALKMYAGAIRL